MTVTYFGLFENGFYYDEYNSGTVSKLLIDCVVIISALNFRSCSGYDLSRNRFMNMGHDYFNDNATHLRHATHHHGHVDHSQVAHVDVHKDTNRILSLLNNSEKLNNSQILAHTACPLVKFQIHLPCPLVKFQIHLPKFIIIYHCLRFTISFLVPAIFDIQLLVEYKRVLLRLKH